MTSSSAIPHLDSYAPGVVTRAPEGRLGGSVKVMLGTGVVALGISCIGLFLEHDKEQFFFSYLVAYMFTLSLALGALCFVMIQHVSRAGWSIVVRRVAENMAATLGLLAILILPIVLGSHTLFHHWIDAPIDPAKPGYDAVSAGKTAYLNEPFFYSRMLLYFVIWIGLSRYFRRTSIAQDESGDPELSIKMARRAAPGLALFGLSITFAAIDWMMSLDPHWFSTMFGVIYFSGSLMAFLGILALVLLWMRGKGLLAGVVNIEHYHDIGKLLFAFMVFWAYVSFSQYFLIQYADLPEETSWYLHRAHGTWATIGTILVVGHFLAPFTFLLSRHMKRNTKTLAVGALLLLVMHWFDMQFTIMPIHHKDDFAPHWLDASLMIGFVCLFLGFSLRNISKSNLLPVRDPKLKESLNFVNF